MTTSEPRGAFQTHSNYLRGFAFLACPSFISWKQAYANIGKRVLESGVLPKKGASTAELDHVRQSLENAWGTELLLTLGEQFLSEEETIRLSNNWNVIQGYYVTYHATQAIAAAKQHQRPTTHAKTQTLFFELLGRPGACLPPWTLAFGPDGILNSPPDLKPDALLHAWTSCTDANTAVSLASKAIRTTREEALAQRSAEERKRKRARQQNVWKAEERERVRKGRQPRHKPPFRLPRLTQTEKLTIQRQLRPFTLMDYLYRLRLRCNYEDSAMFTDGPIEDGLSTQVRRDVVLLAGSTLFVAELYVQQIIGRSRLYRWVNTWLERNRAPQWSAGLAARHAALAGPEGSG